MTFKIQYYIILLQYRKYKGGVRIMQQLKELVEDLFEYTNTISCSEFELYDNYYSKINEQYLCFQKSREDIHNLITTIIKKDILWDLLYNIDSIKKQILYDIGDYGTDSPEYNDIIKIYNKIKLVFNDFIIMELEK